MLVSVSDATMGALLPMLSYSGSWWHAEARPIELTSSAYSHLVTALDRVSLATSGGVTDRDFGIIETAESFPYALLPRVLISGRDIYYLLPSGSEQHEVMGFGSIQKVSSLTVTKRPEKTSLKYFKNAINKKTQKRFMCMCLW